MGGVLFEFFLYDRFSPFLDRPHIGNLCPPCITGSACRRRLPKMPRPRKPQKQALFGEDEPETTAATRLTTNTKFAERYEAQKRKQDLARARELGFDPTTAGEASSSEESEDDGAALTADLDARVRATIDLIRKKDPRVYDPSVAFFPADADAPGEDEADGVAAATAAPEQKASSKKKERKKTGKDVLREQLLDAVARGAEDAFEEDDEVFVGGAAARRRAAEDSRPAKAYDAEQEALRRAFLESVIKDAALASGDEEEASAAAAAPDAAGGLLKERPRKAGKKKKEEEAAEEDEGELVSRDELKRHLLAKVGGKAGCAR